MDAYLGATETLSKPSTSGAGAATGTSFDATSVVSGRSYKTYGTTFTAQSTRSRRPGQARARLEQGENKAGAVADASFGTAGSGGSGRTRGWQESIEAAAARNGKRWDPEHGWKDYVDPKSLGVPTDDFYNESTIDDDEYCQSELGD